MPADPLDTGATVRLRWSLALEPRAAGELRWTVWRRHRAPSPDRTPPPSPTPRRSSRSRRASPATRARPRTTPGTRGTTAVDSDHELFNLVDRALRRRPAPARQRRPRPGRALHRGRRAVVRDAVRPRLDHHRVPVARVPAAGRGRDAVGARGLPGDRGRRLARRRARQDPPRAADRRDGRGRRAAAHAVLRLGRLDAALADPARRRPSTGPATARCVDRLWPNALAALEWIDTYGDRDGDGFVEYERRSERGLAEPGLEGLQRRDPRPDRHGGRAADRAGRGPGLRLRRQAPDGRPGPGPRRRRAGRRGSTPRPRRSAQRFEDAFWVEDQRYYAMALDGDKRQADAIGSNAGPVPVDRDRRAGAGRATSSSGCSTPAMFSGWGIRTYARGPARLQPDRLPHRARSGRTTRRSSRPG